MWTNEIYSAVLLYCSRDRNEGRKGGRRPYVALKARRRRFQASTRSEKKKCTHVDRQIPKLQKRPLDVLTYLKPRIGRFLRHPLVVVQ